MRNARNKDKRHYTFHLLHFGRATFPSETSRFQQVRRQHQLQMFICHFPLALAATPPPLPAIVHSARNLQIVNSNICWFRHYRTNIISQLGVPVARKRRIPSSNSCQIRTKKIRWENARRRRRPAPAERRDELVSWCAARSVKCTITITQIYYDFHARTWLYSCAWALWPTWHCFRVWFITEYLINNSASLVWCYFFACVRSARSKAATALASISSGNYRCHN